MRRVVVTGASLGIGRAIAIACGRRGDHVVCSARNADALASVAREVEAAGGSAIACAGDVTREEDRVALIEAAGEIDVLVNNAGRGYYARFRDVDVRELEALFALNVIAPLRLTQLALPKLERIHRGGSGGGKGGVVVMMSSVAGVVSSPRLGAYSASKFALEALSTALRAEVAELGVDVVVVRPGPVATAFRENSIGADAREPGVRPPGSKVQTAESVAEYTLSAIARRSAVVETSAFVRIASFGARVAPPIFRAAIRRMKND